MPTLAFDFKFDYQNAFSYHNYGHLQNKLYALTSVFCSVTIASHWLIRVSRLFLALSLPFFAFTSGLLSHMFVWVASYDNRG